MSQLVLQKIRALLQKHDAEFEQTQHSAVYTAHEAAAVRGCSVEMGAKSIVLKTDDVFGLFVMSGSAAMRSRLVRRHLGVGRTRFATAEELVELTGIEPGAVPPFGKPILPLRLYVDPGLLEQERIAFTPGVHTVSIFMPSADYLRVALPEVFSFTGAAGGGAP